MNKLQSIRCCHNHVDYAVGVGVTYVVGQVAVYEELRVATAPSTVLTSKTTEFVVIIHLDQAGFARGPFFVPREGLAIEGSAPLQRV